MKRLTAEAAALNPPVVLTGIVTQTVPEWNGFSLQDATEGVYVAWTVEVAQLKLGQRVEVTGHATPGNFAPAVNADRIRILGQGAMPPAARVSWQKLSTGACDNNYVEVEGVARTMRPAGPPEWDWPALALRLDVGGNLLWAYVRDTGAPPERIMDALVRVRGVCTVFANSKRQFFGGALSVPRRNDVQIEKPGPVDPFDAPLRPMDRLFGYTADSGFEHRTRVEGVATLQVRGGVYIEDGGGHGMLVQAASAAEIRPGDRVEAVGFPAAGVFSAVLDDALARVTGHGAEPEPLGARADAVLQRIGPAPAAPDGVLVRVSGSVLDWAAAPEEETLTLQDGAVTFSARLPSQPKARLLESVKPGSRVAVTGVCVVRTHERGAPRTFELLLRSPGDVVTLRAAPVSRSAAMRAAGVLLAALAVGAVWLALLRRRVAKQTATIRGQIQREVSLEQRYADLVENASDAVYVRDLEGRLLQVNRGCEELTGYPREELLGANVIDLLVPEERAQGREHLERGPGAEIPATEWRLRTKQGGEVAVEVKERFLMEDGHAVRVECIGRDVTARKEAHSAEVTVRRRVEEQLHQSQKMESIGLLAGGVAHDFNNLLTVISGYAQMAMDELPPGHGAREGIAEIAQAAERAAALTRQLLTFSRRQMNSPRVLSLNDLVANLDKMLRRLIGEDIELTLELRAETGTIRADPGQIEQVIMNLAVNARDAMPEGGKLAIATNDTVAGERDGVPRGEYVELTVTDTGRGMAEEVRERIFEPFFTTKEKGKGTGLGLSMVYGIVKQSGGTISVESEAGRGSAFRILLPAISPARAPVAAAAAEQVSDSGSETILLAEDEDGVRRFACAVLRQHGYTVLEAGTGREALEVARRHEGRIDLLLSDLVMPEMGGLDLAERFVEARPGTPVLLMSGYADRPLAPDRATELLSKPFTPAALLARVRKMLGKRTA